MLGVGGTEGFEKVPVRESLITLFLGFSGLSLSAGGAGGATIGTEGGPATLDTTLGAAAGGA